MKHVFCFVLLVANCKAFLIKSKANTVSIKPKSVNVAVKTVLEFNKEDKSEDLRLIDNVQTFISKIRHSVGSNKVERRYFGEVSLKFSEFLERLITTLKNYDDEDLEDVADVLNNELRKYHYQNCKFYELLDNEGIRRFLGNKLNEIKHTSAKNIRERLDEVLYVLQSGNMDDNLQDFIAYVNSLYTTASDEKLNKFIQDLELYRSKTKRTNVNLIKIVRNGIRSILFDHYTSLNVNARRDFKLKLEAIWKDYKHPRKVKQKALKVEYTKLAEKRGFTENKQSTYKINLKKRKELTQKFNKTSKWIPVNDVPPTEIHKSYEFAKKINIEGNRLVFENLDDGSGNNDDQSLANNNKLKIKKYKKVKQLSLRDHAKNKKNADEIENNIEHDVTQDSLDIYTTRTTSEFANKETRDVQKVKLKPISLKTKNYSKRQMLSSTEKKEVRTKYKPRKTKSDKLTTEFDPGMTVDDNLKLDMTVMEAFSSEISEKEVKEQSQSMTTKKSLFLTLNLEDLTVSTKKRIPKKSITRMNYKKLSTWEEKVTTVKETRRIDYEKNVEEKVKTREYNVIKTTSTPQYIEGLYDELPALKKQKTRKHKHHNKYSSRKKHKKEMKYGKSWKKHNGKRNSQHSSEEGISIPIFEDDLQGLVYRKQNDFDRFKSNNNATFTKRITDTNLTMTTKEPKPTENKTIENVNLDLWAALTSTIKPITAVTKTTVPTPEPITFTSVLKNTERSITENSTKPEVATNGSSFIFRSNDKDTVNVTVKVKDNSTVTPRSASTAKETNITTVKTTIRFVLTNVTTQKTSKPTSEAKTEPNIDTTMLATKVKAQTDTQSRTTLNSTSTAFILDKISKQPILKQADNDKGKLVQETTENNRGITKAVNSTHI